MGYWQGAQKSLFGSLVNSIITLLTLAFLVWTVPAISRWAFFDATFFGTASDCNAATGACWAFIFNKLRFILFAFFPAELQWRPVLAVLLVFGLLALTAVPRFWSTKLIWIWATTLPICWLLMAGGQALTPVSSSKWGGLPVTLLTWLSCFSLAIPLAVLLAFARRSQMRLLRILAIIYIELMRATPMVAILYIAMLILLMVVPGGEQFDKIWRALLLITLFWSAYVAEVIRGGLQAIPIGQYEAAKALGLSSFQFKRLVILPQVFRIVIPALVNLAVGFLLATSLLTVIGIFDLLNAAKASATDPAWLGFYDEAYIFAAIIYFAISWLCSRYGRWVEKRL